jgi:hypothetical protein
MLIKLRNVKWVENIRHKERRGRYKRVWRENKKEIDH